MNDVQCFIDRQLGFHTRFNYDNAIKRLVVSEEESFYGLQNTLSPANFDQDPPIFACRFAEASGYEHILALANEDGRVAIQDTTTVKTARKLESFQCHNNAVFDLAWMPGHMSFVTVSGDHTASLWDAAQGSPRRVLSFAGHTRSVKTAAFRPGEPAAFATGARDGHILVWDVRVGGQPSVVVKPDNWLASCHSSSAPKTPGSHGKRARADARRAISVTGLVFRDDLALLSCGECDGNIKAWDLRKSYAAYRREPLPTHSIPYCGSSARNGYTNLIVDDARLRLYASCMDGVVYRFDASTYSALPERRYVGHESGTFYIKACLSPDGAYLVSGSSDKNAYVWDARRPEPVARLVGHRAEVTCAAWCRAGDLALVTCSDDARHKIWRVGREPEAEPPRLELQGRAEPAPRAARGPHWGSPPGKRRARASPGDRTPAAKRARPSPSPSPARTSRRCLIAALGGSPPKRARLDSCEPPPSPPRLAVPSSPGKLRALELDRLPDWVARGEAPHLRLMSPVKKRDTTDWLTRMRRSRPPPGAEERRPAPAPAPAPAPPADRSPRGSAGKNRTLLEYFDASRRGK